MASFTNKERSYRGNRGKKTKVLICKGVLDSHDRAPRYIARALRDAGAEVVLIAYRLAEEIVPATLQEDVDVIGLSFYGSGAVYDTSVVINSLKEKGIDKARVMLGGIFTAKERLKLQEMGVGKICGPGTPINEIIDYVMS